MITILGATPAKKTSRINTRSGRSFPSKLYTAWHKDALLQLSLQSIPPITEYPVSITVEFFFQTLRRKDMDNAFASIADTLVDAGVLVDDSQFQIDQVQLLYGGHDKKNPRAEIYISGLE